jgi:hypothetical protein
MKHVRIINFHELFIIIDFFYFEHLTNHVDVYLGSILFDFIVHCIWHFIPILFPQGFFVGRCQVKSKTFFFHCKYCRALIDFIKIFYQYLNFILRTRNLSNLDFRDFFISFFIPLRFFLPIQSLFFLVTTVFTHQYLQFMFYLVVKKILTTLIIS